MVMSTSGAATDAAVEAILAEFRLWLARERGLSAAAVCCYGKQARKFLSWLPGPVDSAVRQLDSTQVTSFILPGSEHLVGEGNRNGGASLVAVPACDREPSLTTPTQS